MPRRDAPETVADGAVSATAVSVVVALGRPLERAGLARWFEADSRFYLVGTEPSLDGVPGLCDRHAVALVITDLETEAADPIEVMRDVGETSPETRFLVLANPRSELLVPALRESGRGWLADDGPESICAAAISVALGHTVLARAVVLRLLDLDGDGSETLLTARDRDILRSVAAGWGNRAIAAHLGLTEKTVRNCVSRLYQKLGLENRAQLVRYAIESGLIDMRETHL